MKRVRKAGIACALWLAAVVFCVGPAWAAARARYGGTLRIACSGLQPDADPLLADAPSDAALSRLTLQPLCRWQAGERIQQVLIAETTQVNARTWRITLVPNARLSGAGPLTARDVAQSWARLGNNATLSPYRAFLSPLRGEGRQLEGAILSTSVLELSTTFAWPDLPKSLCHPSLAIAAQPSRSGLGFAGVGPFVPRPRGDFLDQNSSFPLGRPYLDRLKVVFVTGRRALRLLSLGQVDLVLGEAEQKSAIARGAALYATYLAFRPERTGGEFRKDFERAVDRTQLTQFFAPAASVPMFNLLPPALMSQAPLPTPAAPATRGVPTPLTLFYDQALPEQRSVAERIQVKLHDLGYRIALKAIPRSELRSRWASGQFDLMLNAVLMPPVPGPALALAIELAGRHDLLASELPAIGAEQDASRREAKARERAVALGPELAVIPLYAQSLVLSSSPRWYLPFDAQGLPQLDDAFAMHE
jgi:peptide/nickel transport system substrate-binding protein